MKTKQVVLIAFGLALLVAGLLVILPERENPQNTAFIANLKSKLKYESDTIKVSEIYPKDWREVCVFSGDAFGYGTHIERDLFNNEFVRHEIVNTNNNKLSHDGNGIIVFLLPQNEPTVQKLEVFRAEFTQMRFQIVPEAVCVDRDKAFLKVKYSALNMKNPSEWKDSDWIEVRLTEEEQE